MRSLKTMLPRDEKPLTRINGGAFVCVVAMAVSEVQPLREQMERRRTIHAADTPRAVKQELGQYFTPWHIADFMASFFPKTSGDIFILDPGAGIGILSCALAERIKSEKWDIGSLSIDAYEIDKSLVGQLQDNLAGVSDIEGYCMSVINDDFLEATARLAKNGEKPRYTHVIMNPPYKKIRTESNERDAARSFGLETVNLYTAFLGAAIVSTIDGGRIVAIVPRSFCNGVYYKPFREFMLGQCAIEHMHLIDSRNTAFKDESVLQENVILMLRKNAHQGDVEVSYSKDGMLKDIQSRRIPFAEIVNPFDREKYINIPSSSNGKHADAKFANIQATIQDVGVQVSTGAVVDFRSRDNLRDDFEKGTVPLLYPVHLKNWRVCWPVKAKKPNAIMCTEATARFLLPRGYYVAVKRFSAKEENRRIVASLVTPQDIPTDKIAFENHLDIFMERKQGLDKYIAYGLTVWLNTTWIDDKFRIFSGHTQVNATDLRNLPYPSSETLSQMGHLLEKEREWSQDVFDKIAKEVASGK